MYLCKRTTAEQSPLGDGKLMQLNYDPVKVSYAATILVGILDLSSPPIVNIHLSLIKASGILDLGV